MKILIVTACLAEDIVRKNISDYEGHELYLKVIPIPIAAFITPKLIVYHLKEQNVFESVNCDKTTTIDNIDLIITSGLVKQDLKAVRDELNIETYKGPSNAADIKLTLDVVDSMKLSTTKAADVLIRDKQYNEAMNLIRSFDCDDTLIHKLLEKDGNFSINGCNIGVDFPMRVLGEIANAITLTDDMLLERVAYYLDSGADMIDVGMQANMENPESAYHMVKIIKDNFDVPVSIDTINSREIKRALSAGADLVLSLDHGNYCKVIDDIKDYSASAVLLPTDYSKNFIPQKALDRVKSLESLDKKCETINTIADPLLDPINSHSLTNSIIACWLLRKRNPRKPLFFGVGNVSELLDADSNGVNAVLSGIAMELGVSILFSPEASLKTKGSIHELKTASDMMFIAKKRNTIPKNVGVNLIRLKDQYNRDDADIDLSDIPHIEAMADGKFVPDYKGSFKIILADSKIHAVLYVDYKKTLVIESDSARAIYEEIIRNDYISRIEHAAYLGMELEKAEIALKLGKNYVQDFPIF